MPRSISTVFIGAADARLADVPGIVQFDYPHDALPVPGDRVTLRIAPDKEAVTFVCRGRHFDFSQGAECILVIELDLA